MGLAQTSKAVLERLGGAVGRDALRLRSASLLLAFPVLVVGVALTLFSWSNLKQSEAAAIDQMIANRAESIEVAIQDRMLIYEAVLHSAVGLIRASELVTAPEWQAFTEQLQLGASYPGLYGIGYAQRLLPDAPAPAVDPALTVPDGSTPATNRDRTSILYFEPLEHNQYVIGFDMMSEPTRRAAMERARDSGLAALSAKIALLRIRDTPSESGFLVFLPVYTDGPAPTSVQERRHRLVGFVYSPFRAEAFIGAVLGRLPNDLTVEVFDGDRAQRDATLYRYGAVSKAALAREQTLSTMGHRWLIRVGALPSFIEHRQSAEPMWTLLAGGTTTLLVAALVFTLAVARQNLANRLKAERLVQQRDQYAASVLENSLDAYVAIDEFDRIVEWNRQAETTFGWSQAAVLGSRLADLLLPERHRARHLEALRSYAERPPRLIGRRLEMPALRADGTEITVELSIVAAPATEGLRFVASMRDITERLRQQAEIVQMNSTLELRIAERTATLAEVNENLRSANEQLEFFAQNVSHDLRAPLRAILGYTGIVLSESDSLDHSSRAHLNTVQRSAERMQRIIDDLLRLAFVRQQPVKKQRVHLWRLIRNILDETTDRLPTVVADADELGDVLADPGLLEQAIRNLISNAIKFSARSPNPSIAFGCKAGGDERMYYIKDNGVGFDQKYADKLFGVFERLHSADKFEGTGIGLSIVKTIIERHGGRVWATSTQGQGATFWFTLGAQIPDECPAVTAP
jgi:PAS domain S-box-containing protein